MSNLVPYGHRRDLDLYDPYDPIDRLPALPPMRQIVPLDADSILAATHPRGLLALRESQAQMGLLGSAISDLSPAIERLVANNRAASHIHVSGSVTKKFFGRGYKLDIDIDVS